MPGGRSEGAPVETAVSGLLNEGNDVGVPVHMIDGESLVFTVGELVVGKPVGGLVGLAVGLVVVGFAVGDAVGKAVGLPVGL